MLCVVVPFVQRGQVNRRKFPLLQRVLAALSEAAFLFFASDVQPELKENDAFREQVAFKGRHFFHEGFVLFFRAEAHNRFNNGAVVPGTVKEDHFTGRGQMRYVALEVPLTFFGFRWFRKCGDSGTSGIEMLGKALDGAPFAGCIATFKNNDELLAFLLDPRLKFQEFNLQTAELFVVKVTVVSVDIRIFTGLEIFFKIVHVSRCRDLFIKTAAGVFNERLQELFLSLSGEAAHHCFSEFVCSGFVSGTKKLLQVLIGIFVTAEVKFRIFEFFGFLFYDSGVLTVNFLRLGCFFVCDRVVHCFLPLQNKLIKPFYESCTEIEENVVNSGTKKAARGRPRRKTNRL